MSAPRVNQMRFLSSVAFARTPKLRFDIACSAADAMRYLLSTAAHRCPCAPQRRPDPDLGLCPARGKGHSDAASAGAAVTVTLPPAACTAAIAAAEAPET